MLSSHSSVLVSTVRWSMKGRKASRLEAQQAVWLRTMSACQPRLESTIPPLRFIAALGCSSGHSRRRAMRRYSLSMLYAPPMATLPIQLVHLAVQSERAVREPDCHDHLTAEAPCRSYPRPAVRATLVVAVDAQQRQSGINAMYCFSCLSVAAVVVDAGVAYDEQSSRAGARCLAEARYALKAPVRVTSEIDIYARRLLKCVISAAATGWSRLPFDTVDGYDAVSIMR